MEVCRDWVCDLADAGACHTDTTAINASRRVGDCHLAGADCGPFDVGSLSDLGACSCHVALCAIIIVGYVVVERLVNALGVSGGLRKTGHGSHELVVANPDWCASDDSLSVDHLDDKKLQAAEWHVS